METIKQKKMKEIREIRIAEIVLTITSSIIIIIGILCHFKILILGEGLDGLIFFIIGGFQGGAALYSFLSRKALRKNK
jgi:hypothetical protein